MARIRFHVETRDVPPSVAARKLGLTLDKFSECLPQLLARGFPPIDKTTGKYDLKAIDRWQDARHPKLLAGDNPSIVPSSSDIEQRVRDRLRSAG